MSDLPIELHQLILSYSDFLTQIRLRCVNKVLHAKLEIHDFYSIDLQYSFRLTNNILQSYPFITRLDIACSDVTDINHLTRLEDLNIGSNQDIRNEGISNLTNLKDLYMTVNSSITNINHLTRLEVLYIEGTDISDKDISNLNLRELYIIANTQITDLNHMTRLEKLCVGAYCGIGDAGIANLNLKELCGIDANGISKLKLKKLIADNNPKITGKEPIVPDLYTCASVYNYFRIQEGSAILRYDT